MRRAFMILGCFLAAFGALFLLQGLGYVRWPASSLMIGRQTWVDRGAVIAVIGLLMILIGRRWR